MVREQTKLIHAKDSKGVINLDVMNIECYFCHTLHFRDEFGDQVLNQTPQLSPY